MCVGRASATQNQNDEVAGGVVHAAKDDAFLMTGKDDDWMVQCQESTMGDGNAVSHVCGHELLPFLDELEGFFLIEGLIKRVDRPT